MEVFVRINNFFSCCPFCTGDTFFTFIQSNILLSKPLLAMLHNLYIVTQFIIALTCTFDIQVYWCNVGSVIICSYTSINSSVCWCGIEYVNCTGHHTLISRSIVTAITSSRWIGNVDSWTVQAIERWSVLQPMDNNERLTSSCTTECSSFVQH